VTALADKTGNFILTANNADQEPTYVQNGLNGKPVLRFNGDQSLYSSDNFGGVLNHDMTIIVVALSTASPQREQFPLYLGQNATPHANRALPYYKGVELFDGQFVGRFGPPVARRNIFIMFAASINPTLTEATFYRNGKKTAVGDSDPIDGDVKFADLSDGVTMGAATDPVCGWEGDIAEELVFDRQLTPGEMQTIWSCLSSKYGLHDVPGAQPSVPSVTTAAAMP
jgi:hypothetical protein